MGRQGDMETNDMYSNENNNANGWTTLHNNNKLRRMEGGRKAWSQRIGKACGPKTDEWFFERVRGPRKEGAGRDRSENEGECEAGVLKVRETEVGADAEEPESGVCRYAEKDENVWLLSLGRDPEPRNVESNRGAREWATADAQQ